MPPFAPDEAIVLANGSVVPPDELSFRFSRSGGPGGQNVNKVATKAELRFRPAHSRGLSEEVRSLLLERLASRLSVEGEIVVTSREHRTQLANRRACAEKLRRLLEGALAPRRARIPTKPTRASRERRLVKKKKDSRRKAERGGSGREVD